MVLSFLETERPIATYHWLVEYAEFRQCPPGLNAYNLESVHPIQFDYIHFAAYLGLNHLGSALLQSGRNPHAQDSNGRTPLKYAVHNGQHSFTHLLLDINGIEINSRDHIGATPLHFAVSKGYVLTHLSCSYHYDC